MSALNLHLDFLNEQEKPIHYTHLTPEEELKIVQDSNLLMEQIDTDLRVLDQMCSALENLLIIKQHYDTYGSSPALESLVGDIHECLGISLEADEEAQSTDNNADGEKKAGGKITGAIKKVWDWIVGIFRRMGQWLSLVDKKVEEDEASLQETLKNSKKLSDYYTVKVITGLYDGKEVKQPANVKELETALLQAIRAAGIVSENEDKAATDIDNVVKKFEAYQSIDEKEIQGSTIKILVGNTFKLYQGTRSIVSAVNKELGKYVDKDGKVQLKMLDNIKDSMKQNDDQNQSYLNTPLMQLNVVIKKSLNVVKLISQRSAISISSMVRAVNHGKAPSRSESEVNNERSEREQAAAQAKQEADAEKEKQKQEEEKKQQESQARKRK